MKVKMIYTLPEEKNEFRLCQNGADYFSALWQIKSLLREYYKYDMVQDVFMDRLASIIENTYFEDID